MTERIIGVVSLIGTQQAKTIHDKLLFELGGDKYQAHDIACVDATTFQDKERDMVFLSMVVGVGQGTKVDPKIQTVIEALHFEKMRKVTLMEKPNDNGLQKYRFAHA